MGGGGGGGASRHRACNLSHFALRRRRRNLRGTHAEAAPCRAAARTPPTRGRPTFAGGKPPSDRNRRSLGTGRDLGLTIYNSEAVMVWTRGNCQVRLLLLGESSTPHARACRPREGPDAEPSR